MAHHPQLAVAAANALQGATDVDTALRALLEAVGTIERAKVYDVGAGPALLVVLPGWQDLEPPENYVKLAERA